MYTQQIVLFIVLFNAYSAKIEQQLKELNYAVKGVIINSANEQSNFCN